MIKNVALKSFLVDYIFPVFSAINQILPKDDKAIFFYCANNELNDNSKALFDYLIENGYTDRYKIVVGPCSSDSNYENSLQNVSYISKIKSIFQYMRSGHVFYCMGKMPIKPSKNQIVINMWHGIPLKKIGLMSNVSNGKEFFFTYVCASSETWRPIMASAFGCPIQNVCVCGEPKSDVLLKTKEKREKKMVVWLPTFRQSDYLGYDDSSMENLVPLFAQNQWGELNEYLDKINVELIVKLHPMQKLKGFDYYEKNNLKIYSARVFEDKIGDVFLLMSQSDALISDYSGVYFDYLILDRPICFVLDDFEEYRDTRGFVFDNPLDYMPGQKAYTKEDIMNFLNDVSSCKDQFTKERAEVNRKVNKYSDGRNCERILELSNVKK